MDHLPDSIAKLIKGRKNCSCIPDEKIQVNPTFWSGSEYKNLIHA